MRYRGNCLTKHIAVVGSGVAGMVSAWLLSQKYTVTLIDKNDYIGGHTNTIAVKSHSREIDIDTGFIVYNEPNYPNLVGMFEHLGVHTRPTTMSFSASIKQSGLEYAGSDIDTLFAQRRNIVSLRFWKLVYDITKFNRKAKALLNDERVSQKLTLGEFLTLNKIGLAMQNDYLLPMAAAIWSCPPTQMLAFPAKSFVQFFNNHGLLNIKDRPQWRTVVGGSCQYIKQLLAEYTGKIIVNNGVVSINRDSDTVILTLKNGDQIQCDEVVIATHADEALTLLDKPTDNEKQTLSAFRYQKNATYLHTDKTAMPMLPKVWSCWNYLASKSGEQTSEVSVTYWMNELQGLVTETDYFVSLNPISAIAPEHVIKAITYMHPVFDNEAMAAQKKLVTLQGIHKTWFVGSYFGYGFHEDALTSAVKLAQKFNVDIPWLKG